MRAQRRALLELSEGFTYRTGCGLEGCDDEIDDPVPLPQANEDTKVVIFDTETTGLGKSAEVVQITAKHGDKEFNQYIYPSKGIAFNSKIIKPYLPSCSGSLRLPEIEIPRLFRNF